ncbi:hypothetical protein ONZ43_g6909 [Nemania bipapillata]|uniref:Uncharacterized protein n=1 Tax=Nemania bipapillata TaxID=110536 RepID=A0ACC2HUX7_9PEZI|nr:hypothetical protein ONZ43_g6909 [Nemania bipapillata]
MGVVSGITHFFESIGETIYGIFAAILQVFNLIFSTIMGVFRGFVNFVEGTLGFAFDNFFVLGTFTAVVLGYLLYAQRNGTTMSSRKVKN